MAIIRSKPSQRIINGEIISTSENVVVSDPHFRTGGEDFIVIKGIDQSTIVLDHTTTDHVKIKALTKVLIVPALGKIDEEFDEVFIEKGACVELVNCSNNWYITSSDGIKMA